MPLDNLFALLTSGQHVVRSGKELRVLDAEGRTLVEYELDAFGSYWPKVELKSVPPKGYFRVTNIYVDPSTLKVVVEYDDTPT